MIWFTEPHSSMNSFCSINSTTMHKNKFTTLDFIINPHSLIQTLGRNSVRVRVRVCVNVWVAVDDRFTLKLMCIFHSVSQYSAVVKAINVQCNANISARIYVVNVRKVCVSATVLYRNTFETSIECHFISCDE